MAKKKSKLKQYVVAHKVTTYQYRFIKASSRKKAIKESQELDGKHGEEYDYDERSVGLDELVFAERVKKS